MLGQSTVHLCALEVSCRETAVATLDSGAGVSNSGFSECVFSAASLLGLIVAAVVSG